MVASKIQWWATIMLLAYDDYLTYNMGEKCEPIPN